MALKTEFAPLELSSLSAFVAERKQEEWRFVQLLAAVTDDGFDLIYSFMKDGVLQNNVISGITKETVVPSITNQFLAAFVFENEVHDLFGIQVKDIAIDFAGNFYQLAQKEPMTIISPAQKEAREKAAKVAAAKAAKEAGATGASGGAAQTDSAASAVSLDEKLAGMDPEKAAKVRAAMEKKAQKEAAEKQAVIDEKIAGLDPEKAAKVKAAMEAKAARETANKTKEDTEAKPACESSSAAKKAKATKETKTAKKTKPANKAANTDKDKQKAQSTQPPVSDIASGKEGE